jgi:N-acetylmuramoyl-L-alanine amidase
MKRICRRFGIFLVLISCFFPEAQAGKDSLGIRTIVIDPGHGGSDPGCIGPSKTHEADVALAISLKLGKRIEEKYGDRIRVIYTRTEDVFVDLAERAKIANRNDADLFICVHANSGPAHAKGSETYVLGLHKTDAQAKVMQRENDVVLLEADHETKYEKLDPNDPDLAILLDLKMQLYMDQSIEFANLIQQYIIKTEGYTDRGVKQAGFLVLHQVNMPSVLVETGFLTNAEEEKILTDDSYQTGMAEAIFDAFVDYKSLVDKKNGIIDKNTNPIVKEEIKTNKEEVKTPDKINPPETTVVVNNNLVNVDKNKTDEEKVVFKVQITTSSKEIELNATNFKGLEGVEMYMDGGMYKYTYGKSNNFDDAVSTQDFVRQKGFTSAFVVAFKKGERIKDIKVAREMANNK